MSAAIGRRSRVALANGCSDSTLEIAASRSTARCASSNACSYHQPLQLHGSRFAGWCCFVPTSVYLLLYPRRLLGHGRAWAARIRAPRPRSAPLRLQTCHSRSFDGNGRLRSLSCEKLAFLYLGSFRRSGYKSKLLHVPSFSLG